MDEDSWERDVGTPQPVLTSKLMQEHEIETVAPETMSALSSVVVRSLARQCQMSYLLGQFSRTFPPQLRTLALILIREINLTGL